MEEVKENKEEEEVKEDKEEEEKGLNPTFSFTFLTCF